ncbi:unnamed protein product [Pneumocystis jirovecii]|uniref:Histidine protein methyltransferase 1 n=1 Tax=Pneumocystis jirovecii TaxID=42068 RepID=L0P9L4_PNEJI|nr:unnamed protein product [Pneumocystis jirovecii]
MSFSFNFEKDDKISKDDVNTKARTSINANMIDYTRLLPPKKHTLEEMLTFLPENISFNTIPIEFEKEASCVTFLPKRELWDIRLQLMKHDYDEYQDELQLLNSNKDILPYIYENKGRLGCGSALPSVTLFIKTLYSKNQSIKFTLQDYNISVLKFSAIPNIFLAWAITKNQKFSSLKEINITDTLKERFLSDLSQQNITIECFSGGWCNEMNCLIQDTHDLVLGSETIYSKQNLDPFINMLVYNIKNRQDSEALVAAKKVYFGLDTSIEDFVQKLKEYHLNYSVVYENMNSGIIRFIKNNLILVKHLDNAF